MLFAAEFAYEMPSDYPRLDVDGGCYHLLGFFALRGLN